jgi:hypothetical protein
MIKTSSIWNIPEHTHSPYTYPPTRKEFSHGLTQNFTEKKQNDAGYMIQVARE